jgi:hypothetical protein
MSYMRPHISGTERVDFSKQYAQENLVVDSLQVIFLLSACHRRFLVQKSIEKMQYIPFLLINPQTDTFLCDISPAKLRSIAQVRNPQGISKLMNKVDCQAPRTLLKAIVHAFLTMKSFAAGSSTYLCNMACVSKSVPRVVISSSDCCCQRHRSTMDVTHDSWG